MNGKGATPRQQTKQERERFEREYDRIFRKKPANKVREETNPGIIKMLRKSLKELKAGKLVSHGSFARFAKKPGKKGRK